MSARRQNRISTRTYVKENYQFYLMLLPALAFVLLFNIVPMYGIMLAFKDYDMFAASSPFLSILKSPWVGLKHFQKLFSRPEFLNALRNTLLISVQKILFGFPVPIIFAILLNELRSIKLQKSLQTLVYLPHFLSWAVVAGIFVSLLGSTGMVNSILTSLGLKSVSFLMDNRTFPGGLITTDIWKEFGWSSIIYFAAIAGLDPSLAEAAEVDGANRFQRIWNVTIPGIMPTIVLQLILRVGGIMEAGFGQVFAMYNPTVYESGDIIGTYVYRIGLGKMDFSMGTAVGLFNSVIAFILVISSNMAAKKMSGKSIW